MHELLIKYSEGGLTEDKMCVITRWVKAYQYRKLLFQDLKQVMEFEKRLEATDDAEIGPLLDDMAKKFPGNYAEISAAQIGPFILRPALKESLRALKFEIIDKIVYRSRWIRVLIFLIRAVLLILIIVFILKTLFKGG